MPKTTGRAGIRALIPKAKVLLLTAAFALTATTTAAAAPAAAPPAPPAPAASGWQPVAAPDAQGFSSYLPFGGGSAFARSSKQTTVTCLPCEYVHTLWSKTSTTAWRKVPLPTGGSTDVLAGTAPDDAWGFGRNDRGYFSGHHWNGTAWTNRTVPDMETLAARATSRGTVWAVGNLRAADDTSPGVVARWDGAKWSLAKFAVPGHATSLRALHVVSDNDIWAVGSTSPRVLKAVSRPYAVHWDGTSWSEVELPAVSTLSARATAVTVGRNGEVWIGGMDRNPWADAGTGPPKAFALRRDAAGWKLTFVPVTQPTGEESRDSLEVSALAFHDGQLLAGLTAHDSKNQSLARWTGTAWEPLPGPGTGSYSQVAALTTTADGTLWASGLYSPRYKYEGFAASLAPGASAG
ncbi:hypothetical protein ABZ383_20650 [Streptomyces sp. NPDC005900]|uniref:hypothetical protein n=1 Tax=Streptomyces sp. NPDC005900 TaxID=3154569 RepID=UPI00340FDAAD